jgi:ribosomal protein S18 acetylase RimI-like enzyme
MSVTIRSASEKDLEQVTVLENSIFGQSFNIEYLLHALEFGMLNVAIIDEKMVGYIIVNHSDVYGSSECEEINKMKLEINDECQWLEITAIGVLEDFRNNKIGNLLMTSVINDIQEGFMLFLRVRSSNMYAQKLYLRNNFIFHEELVDVDGKKEYCNVIIKNYYSSPIEDALLMYHLK